MEPKFSTSFIPKQTLSQTASYKAPRQKTPKGALTLLFIVSLVVFAGSGVIATTVYFNQQILQSSLDSKRTQIIKAREAFQPELVREMTRLDRRLILAKTLLEKHAAPSEIYGALSSHTLQTVRYNSFRYQLGASGDVSVSLEGVARGFSSIALQTDEFVKSRVVLNPVFSGFNLNEDGTVRFTFTASIDPRYISYQRTHQNTAMIQQ